MLYIPISSQGFLSEGEKMKRQVDCHEIITSDDYIDVVRESDFPSTIDGEQEERDNCIQRLNEQYSIYYLPKGDIDCDEMYKIQPYVEVPNVFGLEKRAVEAAGIPAVFSLPALNLMGQGTLIGVIDTGIDYTHPAFIFEDGTSKIVNIWDQSLGGNPPEGFLFGTEFSQAQLNEALKAEDPLTVVPELDDNGHGTFLAGVAAGRENKKENFIGAAPDAELIVVKVKGVKKCLREFYLIRKGAVGFQSNDILLGINYVLQKAKQIGKPIVILLGCGDNMGPHDGNTFTEKTLELYARLSGVVITVPAGNEASLGHHYHGNYQVDNEDGFESVQFNVADNEPGFYINFWNYMPDKFSIALTSPSGTDTGQIPFRVDQKQEITFIAEKTQILVEYAFVEGRTGDEAIFIRLKDPSPGIWNLKVFGELVVDGRYDIWLPREGFAKKETVFLAPDPYITMTTPSTNKTTITVGAFNDITKSLYIPSGRGLTRDLIVKPDLVAPGVNVLGPIANGQYGFMSGTSIATALVAGASALLLEWGFVKGNNEKLDTITAKTYLVRGANRRESLDYPNREWGFGELNLLNTFKLIEIKS